MSYQEKIQAARDKVSVILMSDGDLSLREDHSLRSLYTVAEVLEIAEKCDAD